MIRIEYYFSGRIGNWNYLCIEKKSLSEGSSVKFRFGKKGKLKYNRIMIKTGLLVIMALFFPKAALANCPVCVVTVGGGLILADKLGIDTLLVSIWIAGLNTAVAFMIADKIKKSGIWKNGYLWSLIFLTTALVYVYWSGQAGSGNNLWGIDKSVLGMSLGTGTFFGAVQLDRYIRSKKEGKVLFYYQKVIIPFVSLLMVTIVLYFLL